MLEEMRDIMRLLFGRAPSGTLSSPSWTYIPAPGGGGGGGGGRKKRMLSRSELITVILYDKLMRPWISEARGICMVRPTLKSNC